MPYCMYCEKSTLRICYITSHRFKRRPAALTGVSTGEIGEIEADDTTILLDGELPGSVLRETGAVIREPDAEAVEATELIEGLIITEESTTAAPATALLATVVALADFNEFKARIA